MTSAVQPDEPDRAGRPLAPRAAGEPPTMPPAAPRRGRGRWIVLGAAVLVLAGGAAAAWQLLRPPPPAPPDPPMPQGIQQPEVRATIEAARQNVLQKPRSADAWGLLGMTLEAQLYEPEADRCFAEAARLDPSDPRWPYFRGLYAQKYDPAHAVPFFREALAAAGSSPEEKSAVRLRLAETLLEERKLDEAEPLFQEELRLRPSEARAAYGLGLIAMARGDQAAAQKRLTAAAADPNTRKKATAQLAALARSHGDDAGAAAYEKEWAKMSDDPTAWPDPLVEQVARLQVASPSRSREVGDLEREGRYQEAADIYLQQIEEDANNAAAYTGAGLDLFHLGQYDRGLRAAPGGSEAADPASSAAHYGLAQALFTWVEKAQRQKPGDAASSTVSGRRPSTPGERRS